MITDHHNKHNTNEKKWITKMWYRDTKGANAVRKTVPKDTPCRAASYLKLFFFKAVSVKQNKAKHN